MKNLNKKNFRIIDATHVSSGGGQIILELLLKELDLSKNDILLCSKNISQNSHAKTVTIESEISRIFWYVSHLGIRNTHRVININSSISIGAIHFSNIVYFHNVTFFDRNAVKIYQKLVLLLCIKYEYLVQTNYAQIILKNSIGIESKKLPFYREYTRREGVHIENKYRVFHISSEATHKQNFMFDEVVDLLDKKGYQLYSTNEYGNDSVVVSISNIENRDLLDLLEKGGILLNTSRTESLCLPLIEAAQRGLTILTYDAPYVWEVVDNVYSFKTVDELREMINKESLNKEASLVIENNLNQLNSLL